MSINKYFPFAVLYFFFNSMGLPFGLTYTALLAPFFYWWIISARKKEILLPFIAALFPFIFIHITIVGTDTKAYVVSLINLTAIYIFCQAFYTFLKKCRDIEKIFRRLLIINFIFCLIAIPFYYTSYFNIFWIQQALTEGVNDFKRFKLFTYEASYYATLFVPLFFFYYLQVILKQNKINAWLLMPVIILPYILSFSLGAISAIFIAIAVMSFFYFPLLIRKRRVINIIVLLTTIAIPMFVLVIIFFPDNTIFLRLQNIFIGEDTSGRGRTSEAFLLAAKILDQKSQVWGIGLGQVKIAGEEIIRDFYLYAPEYSAIAIPNATAETWAIFGWAGLSLRFLIQFFLFFYTKVWTSYYRLLLFLFIFLYQFTGSFITNVAEYVIWILAFTEVFPQFRIHAKPETPKLEV